MSTARERFVEYLLGAAQLKGIELSVEQASTQFTLLRRHGLTKSVKTEAGKIAFRTKEIFIQYRCEDGDIRVYYLGNYLVEVDPNAHTSSGVRIYSVSAPLVEFTRVVEEGEVRPLYAHHPSILDGHLWPNEKVLRMEAALRSCNMLLFAKAVYLYLQTYDPKLCWVTIDRWPVVQDTPPT